MRNDLSLQQLAGAVGGTAFASRTVAGRLAALEAQKREVSEARVPAQLFLAQATVDDGGVIDVQALPAGAGAYALVLHDSTGGDAAFTLWEVLTEQR